MWSLNTALNSLFDDIEYQKNELNFQVYLQNLACSENFSINY